MCSDRTWETGPESFPGRVTSKLGFDASIGVCQMREGIRGRANHLFKGTEAKATRCGLLKLQRCWSLKHTEGAGKLRNRTGNGDVRRGCGFGSDRPVPVPLGLIQLR